MIPKRWQWKLRNYIFGIATIAGSFPHPVLVFVNLKNFIRNPSSRLVAVK